MIPKEQLLNMRMNLNIKQAEDTVTHGLHPFNADTRFKVVIKMNKKKQTNSVALSPRANYTD
jgi:hypothetical protein